MSFFDDMEGAYYRAATRAAVGNLLVNLRTRSKAQRARDSARRRRQRAKFKAQREAYKLASTCTICGKQLSCPEGVKLHHSRKHP